MSDRITEEALDDTTEAIVAEVARIWPEFNEVRMQQFFLEMSDEQRQCLTRFNLAAMNLVAKNDNGRLALPR